MANFYMADRRASSQVIKRLASKKKPNALNLWLALKDICNYYGIAVASQTALENVLHVKSRQTVFHAVQYLVKNHLIKVGKIGNQNAYILNPNIIWRTHRNYGRSRLADHNIYFPGIITLTKKENRKLYDEYKNFTKENPPMNPERSLAKIKFNNIHHGKANKNGEPVDHHNKYTKHKKNAINKADSLHNKAQQTSLFNKNTDYSARMTKLNNENNKKSAHK